MLSSLFDWGEKLMQILYINIRLQNKQCYRFIDYNIYNSVRLLDVHSEKKLSYSQAK